LGIFTSSTTAIPEALEIPRHVAVIMDGNGRWAKQRFLPRVAGHKVGVENVRSMIKHSVNIGVKYLTLFAFSSENWRRPAEEVSFLMGLFMEALKKEVAKLHKSNVRFVMIGDRTKFSEALCYEIASAELLTKSNTGLTLTIAANYGGRWDLLQAMNAMQKANPSLLGNYNEEHLSPYLSMSFSPEPDLFIRTGGEKRISNFLLWQLAYSELYFTDTLWPDFDDEAFKLAIQSYQQRERRFGRTSEQLVAT
jgi:undecaprenyl diphosphate synthase